METRSASSRRRSCTTCSTRSRTKIKVDGINLACEGLPASGTITGRHLDDRADLVAACSPLTGEHLAGYVGT